MISPINAVVGILIKDSQILISQRPLGKPMAGYWEFPGGKIEAEENPKQALVRELKEEVDVTIDPHHLQYLLTISYNYSHGSFSMPVFLCFQWQGDPHPCEKQKLKWVSLKDLKRNRLLPANMPIIEALEQIFLTL